MMQKMFHERLLFDGYLDLRILLVLEDIEGHDGPVCLSNLGPLTYSVFDPGL